MSVYAPLAGACLPRLAGGCLPKRISRKSRNALFRHPEEARSFCLLARAKTSASLRASTLCFCKAQTSRVGAHKRPASPKTEPRAAWRSRRISCVRICVAPFKRFLGYARNDGACEKSQCRQAAGRANKIFPPSRIFVKHRCQKRKRHSCLKTAFPRIYNLFDVRLTGRTAAGRPHGKWIISSLINPAPQSGAGSNSIDFYFRAVWSADRPAPSGEILLCVRLSLQETGK